jgi:hypothetical protein
MESKLLEFREQINTSYIIKYTNHDIDDELKTCCYITKKALLHLFECIPCEQEKSNFITIYFEYKNIGHVCCLYNNQIYQSFEGHNYLQITPLRITIKKLLSNIRQNIALFYPMKYIELDILDDLYVQTRYYFANACEKIVISNINRLIS